MANSLHVIITGGSSGIGLALAEKYITQGAHVSLLARSPEKLMRAEQILYTIRIFQNQKIKCYSCDVRNRREVELSIQQAITAVGPPDIVITSAGIVRVGYFKNLHADDFRKCMEVNYFGTLHVIRSVLPLMVKNNRGHLVILSSGAGLIGIFGYTAYSPSKFAVRGLAESLRAELKRTAIGVSVVYPPDTETPQKEKEEKFRPLETALIAQAAKICTADKVAACIVKGIEKKRFIITIGLAMLLLSRLHSLIQPWLFFYLDKIAATAVKLKLKTK